MILKSENYQVIQRFETLEEDSPIKSGWTELRSIDFYSDILNLILDKG